MPLPADLLARIETIRSDRLSGARELAARAAEVLMLADPGSVAVAAEALIAAQPMMAPVVNVARLATSAADVRAACCAFLERMSLAAERVAERGAALIADGATVMTHSSSATVLAALLEAQRQGRWFSVIATESRPQCEGVALAERLGSVGVQVTVIVDAAAYRFLPRAQLVLIGADSASSRGLVNKVGTSMIALAAWRLGVQVYALCGSEKLLPASYPLPEEPPKNPREVLEREMAGVAAENYYFDVTPLEYLTGIVTEDGVQSAADLR